MKPHDIKHLYSVSPPAPDAAGAPVFAVSWPDPDANRIESQLYGLSARAPLGVRRLTQGRAEAPTSTAGVLGFLRPGSNGKPQVYLTAGGEAWQATDAPLGVRDFALAPDGRALAYTARIPEPGRYGTDAEVDAESEPPRRITAKIYLANGVGYIRDRAARAFVAAIAPPELGSADSIPEAVPVSPEGIEAAQVDWADESTLSFVANLGADPWQPDLRSDVLSVRITRDGASLSGADPVALTGAPLSIGAYTWAPGRRLLLVAQDLGPTGLDFVAKLGGLYLREPGGTLRRITEDSTVELDPAIAPIVRGDDAVVGVITDGAVRLAAIPLGAPAPVPGSALRFLTPGDTVVTGARLLGADLYAAVSTPGSAGELAVVRASGEFEVCTSLGEKLRSEARLARVVPLAAQGEGGEVHGWLTLPAGDGPHPVIVNIHGGPFAQYTHALFDEAQVLAKAGYAVVMANPRGSNGRGADWGRAVVGDMAGPAAADVFAVLEEALRRYPLDAGRMGIQGGSYGGFLTAMIIAADHRFAGAIVERGYLSPESFVGTSDIGLYFSEAYTGTDPDAIAAQSPLRHAGSVRTPTLVMHSERDYRCPLEQAQQYFAALHRAGVDTELVVFPGENHELSRAGQPAHRASRHEIIVDWWRRRIPTAKS